MPANVTKTDIEFHEFRVWKQEEEDGIHWYASVGYAVATEEGETWRKNLTEEVTGTLKTKASALFTAIRNHVKTREGLA